MNISKFYQSALQQVARAERQSWHQVLQTTMDRLAEQEQWRITREAAAFMRDCPTVVLAWKSDDEEM